MKVKPHVCVVLLVLLIAAACGARLTDEQKAALQRDSSSERPDTTVTSIIASGPVDADDETGQGSSGQVEAGPSGGTGDAPAGPSGGGDDEGGGVVVVGGSSCAGGGASDTGVTADEIKVGNVSTISGPVPGFGQTGVNGVKAYVNMVNATGGVCGRRLTLVTADDRLQSGTNKSETEKLANDVIGFVGGTTVVDGGAAQALAGTQIAETGMAITDAMIRSPNHFPTIPINLDEGGNNAAAVFRYMRQVEGVTSAALVWPAQASAKARMDGYKQDLRTAGIEVVVEAEVDIIHTNYGPQARTIAAREAEIVITTLEISGMSNLAKALHQEGYQPKVPFYGAQVYGQAFINLAGPASEGTKVGIPHAILEDAGSVPAIADMLEWYTRTNPGSEIDFFTFQGWAAADLYVSALAASDGPPTREKVLNNLRATTSFGASGLMAEINPANKTTSGCFMVAEIRNGQWMRTHPSSGFDCSFS